MAKVLKYVKKDCVCAIKLEDNGEVWMVACDGCATNLSAPRPHSYLLARNVNELKEKYSI